MSKIKIKIVVLGNLPHRFDIHKIKQWNSNLFEISEEIDYHSLTCNSDTDGWAYSDNVIANQLPSFCDADFLVALTNVPLEDNWYSRRLKDNKVSFTFHEIKDLLVYNNIPLENVVLRILYAYSFGYMMSGNKIPSYDDTPGFTHDETRGCLYDMNGIKFDLVESCDNPIICKDCRHNLSIKKVPLNLIDDVRKELKKIRKTRYYRWADFIKVHPIISLTISLLSVVCLGILSSVIASLLYEYFIKNWL
ncbi:hypothetical protein [Yersinia massiliensis]|uniref:hypothetical protein n=1 Tax=Yersinia massiliensis TaxID=419257 RepID=UPI000C154D08|nr:hypothetical protein [Yersinia massiliensis]PHZ21489.1 hypothetical protein CS535_22330 [Yersinia massiliensis]